MPTTQIQINASTSVVLVDTSVLTAGGVAVVLLSSIQTPGRVITVRDSTGYLSTPQIILVSTTNGVVYSDGTSSIAITQPFGFISFESRDSSSWNIVNTFGFPLYQTIANVKSLQTSTITSDHVFASNTISTNYFGARSVQVQSTMEVFGPTFVSSLVVGMYPDNPLAYQYAPYSFYVNGTSQFNSNVKIDGKLNVVQNISTGGALLVAGSISTIGDAGIGGSITASGNLRVGGNIAAGTMSIQGSTTMTGNVGVGSDVIVQNALFVTNTISTSYFTTSTLNTLSSITLGTSKSIISSANGITFSAPIAAPGLSTTSLTVNDTLTTSTLAVTGSINASSAPTFILGTTDIQNPGGSLAINTITANNLAISTMTAGTVQTSSIAASTITLTGNLVGSPTSIASFYQLNVNTISSQSLSTVSLAANTLTASTIRVSSAIIQQSITLSGGSMNAQNLQMQGANLSVSSIGATELYVSSLTVNSGFVEQAFPVTIKPGLFTTLATTSSILTSSLYVTGNLNVTNMAVGSLTTSGSNGPYLTASNLVNTNVVSGTGDYLNPLVFSNTTAGSVAASFYINWNAGSPIPNSIMNVQLSFIGATQASAYMSLSGQNSQLLTAYGPGNTSVTSNFTIDSSVAENTNVLTLAGLMVGSSGFSVSATYSSNANYTNIDSNSVLSFYNGGLLWNYSLNDTVIRNPYNDMTIRNVYYYGGLSFSSDPILKQDIEMANISTCYDTIRSLPLRRFKYTDKYISTFSIRDVHRLGVLATEVEEFFPKSITLTEIPGFESTVRTVDIQQIEMAHLGATKYLMRQVESLAAEIKLLTESNGP